MINKVSFFFMYAALLTGAGVLAGNRVMAEGLQSPTVTGTLGGPQCTGYWIYQPLSASSFKYLKLNNTGAFTVAQALAGNAADPGGNVELCADIYQPSPPAPPSPPNPPTPAAPFFSGPPICLSGSFPTSGNTIKACSLTSADWQSTDGTGKTLAQRYYEEFFAAYPDLLATLNAEFAAKCPPGIDIFNNFFNNPNYLAAFSAPNISYINQNGDTRIGLAGLYNATPLFAAISMSICPGFNPAVLAPFKLQASQVVKVQVNGGNDLFLYGFAATQSGRYDDDDGDPQTFNADCQTNRILYKLVYKTNPTADTPFQVCSYSGNYELALGFDFGDLPDQYGTLLSSDGARNYTLAKDNPYLGTPPDDEADGQPTQDAKGDNINYNDDEDGVFIPRLQIGSTRDIGVNYVNPRQDSVYLNAWLDTNGDGALEQIATNTLIPPGSGEIRIPVTIPDNARPGRVYARFRISSKADLGLTGPAPDGEVEDYGPNIVKQSPLGVPIHPLTVWLTMLGLALTTVFYRRRQHRR